MPPIYINGQEVVKRYVGIQEVVAAYVGAQQIFSSGATLAQIQALFASGEIGVILDYKDATALFKDNLGGTPVTADGQPVGLILDKSKGLALGSERLPQGWLAGSTAGLTLTNITGTGPLFSFNGAANELQFQVSSGSVGTIPGRWYVAECAGTAGSLTSSENVSIRGAIDLGVITSGSTFAFKKYFVANQNYNAINVYGNAVGNITFTKASIREIAGNHASQATSAARPLYAATGLSKWVNYDAVDDAMGITFASSLGSNCTIARANVGSAPTILTGQTIGTSYSDSTDNAGLVIINRALTGPETATLTSYLTQMGATS